MARSFPKHGLLISIRQKKKEGLPFPFSNADFIGCVPGPSRIFFTLSPSLLKIPTRSNCLYSVLSFICIPHLSSHPLPGHFSRFWSFFNTRGYTNSLLDPVPSLVEPFFPLDPLLTPLPWGILPRRPPPRDGLSFSYFEHLTHHPFKGVPPFLSPFPPDPSVLLVVSLQKIFLPPRNRLQLLEKSCMVAHHSFFPPVPSAPKFSW